MQFDSSAVSNAKKRQLELEQSRKEVSPKVYSLYIKSAGGIAALLVVFAGFAVSAASTAFSSWWLKDWFRKRGHNGTSSVNQLWEEDDEVIDSETPDFNMKKTVYAAAIGVIFVSSFFRTIFFVLTTTKASKILHQGILGQLFASRMRTLDKIGAGQVFNMFARDVDEGRKNYFKIEENQTGAFDKIDFESF